MNIEDAIACLKANGYKVSKPRKTKADLCMEKIVAHQKLNTIGRPYGENFDPNYRMKYHTPSPFRGLDGKSTAASRNAKAVYEAAMTVKHNQIAA